MGHLYLGNLPKTYRWKNVIQLLDENRSVAEIAEASFWAAQNGFKKIPDDLGFTLTLTNIFKFIEAAQSTNFEESLNKNGFKVEKGASYFDVISSFKDKIDRDLNQNQALSDVSELAQNSFTQNLTKYISNETLSLFESTSQTVQDSITKQLKGKSFKGLMHEFYTTFTTQYLKYYLSRELPNHVGKNLRFDNISQHADFDRAFDLFVRQTVRITDEFTPGWFGKTKYEGNLDHESVSKYAHIAFKKIRNELKRGLGLPPQKRIRS